MTTKVNGDTGVSQCQPNSVSQDDLQANVVGKGPMFSAWRNGSQSLPDITDTTVLFNATTLDTHNGFDVSNGRYTAKVAGWYQINWVLAVTGIAANVNAGVVATLTKNGVTISGGISSKPASNLYANPGGSALVYMNGTTDYISINAYPDAGGGSTSIVGDFNWRNLFSGFLVRVA